MLYFFGSSSHTNAADFSILKQFQRFVNVLPVLARADCFQSDELYKLKLDIIDTAIDRKVKFLDCQKAIDSVVTNVTITPLIADLERASERAKGQDPQAGEPSREECARVPALRHHQPLGQVLGVTPRWHAERALRPQLQMGLLRRL